MKKPFKPMLSPLRPPVLPLFVALLTAPRLLSIRSVAARTIRRRGSRQGAARADWTQPALQRQLQRGGARAARTSSFSVPAAGSLRWRTASFAWRSTNKGGQPRGRPLRQQHLSLQKGTLTRCSSRCAQASRSALPQFGQAGPPLPANSGDAVQTWHQAPGLLRSFTMRRRRSHRGGGFPPRRPAGQRPPPSLQCLPR